MFNAFDLVVLLLGNALALAFLCLGVWKRCARRYLYLSLYVGSIIISGLVRDVFLWVYGLRSKQYFYAYFISDLCLVILLYVAILSILELILQDSPLRNQVRLASGIFFLLVVGMSYGF